VLKWTPNGPEKWEDQRIHGTEIWRRKWTQEASNTIGRRWRQQPKIELDEEEWMVAYDPHRATRLKERENNDH